MTMSRGHRSDEAAPSRRRWRFGRLGVVGLASIMGLAYCLVPQSSLDTVQQLLVKGTAFAASKGTPLSGPGGMMSSPKPDYITAPVERGILEDVVSASGTLKPVETVEIGSQLSGEVAQLFVDFNDEVQTGEPLARLDQRTFKAKLDQEESALDVAKASVQVQLAKLERARIDLANARASREILVAKLENAQALRSSAAANFDRQKTLRSTSAVSIVTFETAEMELASKTAFVKENSTELDLHSYSVNGAAADVKRLEAELEQTLAEISLRQAAVRIAQIDLDRTTIRSPINGVVVGRFINQGQTLVAGLEARTIFTVARDLGEMEIHARIDETDIGRLKPGQRASFTVDAYPNRRFQAFVRQVRKSAEVSQNVVTYTVVLTTDNRAGLLLPGMTAVIRIVVYQADSVLKVPLAALRFRPERWDGNKTAKRSEDNQSSVWVAAADGSIKRILITTGASTADQVVLKDGPLAETDRLVVGMAGKPPERRLFGVRLWF